MCACVCVHACVHVCACVGACVHACMCVLILHVLGSLNGHVLTIMASVDIIIQLLITL